MTWLNMDRAAVYSMGYRSLSIVTGPVTVLMIAAFFTPEMQGYFYTFVTIFTMQTLLEMGLGTALQQFASHEWARLRLNEKGAVEGEEGARSRLAMVAWFGLRWYAVVGVLAMIGFAVGGWFFFSRSPGSGEVVWERPWLILSVIAGFNLFLMPGLSILEGCNQVRAVYGFRLAQGLVIRIVLWIGMFYGLGLWALVFERAVTVVLTLLFYLFRYTPFFRSILACRAQKTPLWKNEIWPLQWRIAVVWISGFIPSLFIPALFALQGPVEAGRLGMTWTICTALVAVANAFVAPRMPGFAMLIAKKEYTTLDTQFSLAVRGNVIVYFLGTTAFIGALAVLTGFAFPLADRFIALWPTVLFLIALFFQQLRLVLCMYLRAHKQEPYVAISLIEAVLMGCLLLPMGKAFGALGLIGGFLVVSVVIFYPAWLIYQRCKLKWHNS